MKEGLNISKLGKLRIYTATGDKVPSKGLLRKVFSKSKYVKIMQEARASGIMQAHVFHTHAAVRKGGSLTHHSVEGYNSGLTVCIELVDEKAKLQEFFVTHGEMLKQATVIFKEVEIWECKE